MQGGEYPRFRTLRRNTKDNVGRQRTANQQNQMLSYFIAGVLCRWAILCQLQRSKLGLGSNIGIHMDYQAIAVGERCAVGKPFRTRPCVFAPFQDTAPSAAKWSQMISELRKRRLHLRGNIIVGMKKPRHQSVQNDEVGSSLDNITDTSYFRHRKEPPQTRRSPTAAKEERLYPPR